MNERSSRSHSVFTLRIRGTNAHTGQACEGALNLVDLAGSERLNASGAGKDKDRLRETQNINKSLSALGDVIAALGEKSEKSDKHIPYRNSKVKFLFVSSCKTERSVDALCAVDVPVAKFTKWEFQDIGEWDRMVEGLRRTLTPAQMFLNLSPMAAHLNESLCSLRFATKASTSIVPDGRTAYTVRQQVNNTHVGTAKKQVKSTS